MQNTKNKIVQITHLKFIQMKNLQNALQKQLTNQKCLKILEKKE